MASSAEVTVNQSASVVTSPASSIADYHSPARLHPDPYAGLADDELSPLDLDDTETHDSRLN